MLTRYCQVPVYLHLSNVLSSGLTSFSSRLSHVVAQTALATSGWHYTCLATFVVRGCLSLVVPAKVPELVLLSSAWSQAHAWTSPNSAWVAAHLEGWLKDLALGCIVWHGYVAHITAPLEGAEYQTLLKLKHIWTWLCIFFLLWINVALLPFNVALLPFKLQKFYFLMVRYALF